MKPPHCARMCRSRRSATRRLWPMLHRREQDISRCRKSSNAKHEYPTAFPATQHNQGIGARGVHPFPGPIPLAPGPCLCFRTGALGMDISTLTIDSVREGLQSRRFSAVELSQEALRFAQQENPRTNAYLRLSPERALASARRTDERLARGEDPGALAG